MPKLMFEPGGMRDGMRVQCYFQKDHLATYLSLVMAIQNNVTPVHHGRGLS